GVTARGVGLQGAAVVGGGRCRSFFDDVAGMWIDNGTHLVLSGNYAALAYARKVGTEARLQGPGAAVFPFIDLASKRRWTLRFSEGLFPWWIFDKNSRVPETNVSDYFALARLLWASMDEPLGNVLSGEGPLFERLLSPFFLAALNVSPLNGSRKLAAALLRETIALGGKACRPMLAYEGIGNVFAEPAVDFLQTRGVT